MRVLIVNDDGMFAPGVHALAERLMAKHEVCVVAPKHQQSGFSHMVSLHRALHFEAKEGLAYPAYTVDGSPCDCVKIGIDVLFRDVDLVLSGVNDTTNLGDDIMYSGTVNAAMEGALAGIPSVAVSCDVKNDDYAYVAAFVDEHLEQLTALAAGRVISVNFPSSDPKECKGVRVARCGAHRYDDHFVKREDGYYLVGDPLPLANSEDSDVLLVRDGYIAIAPVKPDYTDHGALRAVEAEVSKW